MKELTNKLAEMTKVVNEMIQAMAARIDVLEAENAELKAKLNDGWRDRVTYDNTVEQIAACEDAKERDEARKLIEPMLKKEMATKFRKDIRRKVKELNEGGANIVIQQAEVRVQSPGNNIAHTIYTKE